VLFTAVALAAPSKGSTKASLQKKTPTCATVCNDDYTPVCGGDGQGKDISFGNKCVMERYNCENQKDLKIVQQGECPGGGSVRLA